MIHYKEFSCPHCGAPGRASNGIAEYSCTCRFAHMPTFQAARKAGDVCPRCGGMFYAAPGGTGLYHACATGPVVTGGRSE